MCTHRSTKSLTLACRASGIISGAIAILLTCVLSPPEALCQLRVERESPILLARNAPDKSMMSVTKATGTEDLIWALENHEYPAPRRQAAEFLGARGATEAIPHLLNALKDPEHVVQRAAAEALTKIGAEELFEELIENLKNQRPRVRQFSAYVLGKLAKGEDQRDIPDIIEALEKQARDENRLVREEIVYALSGIGASSSRSIFIEGMKDEYDAVRRHSANALARIKGEEAEEALVDAYGKETDKKTRLTIATALGGFGTPKALDALVENLDKESTSVKIDIVTKLAESGTSEAAAILAKLLVSDASPTVRAAAARGLMTARDPSTIPALTEALGDRVPSVRIAASATLATFADDSITEDLLGAMLDPVDAVAENAAIALVRLGSADIIPELIGMLDNDKDSVVSRAADVLQDLTYKPYGNNVKMWKSWYEENYEATDSEEDQEEDLEEDQEEYQEEYQ